MDKKYRYFWFLVYPDSAPEDWEKQLERSLCPFAYSPLHSPDLEVSKPHWHVMYKHNCPVTIECAKRFIPEGIPANGYVEPVLHPTNTQRYLIHLDNPDKEQFDDGINAITVINGFPLDLARELTRSEKIEIRSKCFDWILDNGIVEYAELLISLNELGNPDMFDYAFNHTIAFNAFLKSLRHGGSNGTS